MIAERPPAAFTLRVSAREQTEQLRLLEVLPNNPGTDREFSFFCRQSMHSQTDDLGPMHACLNVDEILRLIVCELIESEAKASAAALACCRKSFEDPVLDVLWEAQDGPLPLLKSFPADVWSEGGYTVSAPVAHILSSLNCFIRKSFKRYPTPLEWTRFRKYARKIREIRDLGGLRVLSSEVFLALQLCAISEPLFPHMKTLFLWHINGESISFIPLFLSPRTTVISIGSFPSHSTAAVASMVDAFPILCPNLQCIVFNSLPRDPMITDAISRMLIANNPDALRFVHVDSPLVEEAREVIFKLPNLRSLSVTIEKDTSLPSMVLPNLTRLIIKYGRNGDCLSMFHGAIFGKLEVVTFHHGSEQIGDFLEAFERVALAASIQNTLSQFHLYTSCSWNPSYSSLLPFTHLTNLVVEFSCSGDCSSKVDDDIITDLARAMPKLDTLLLGNAPCHEIPIGVTVKGFVALANHCLDLSELCVHFQVDSLREPSAAVWTSPNLGSTALRRDCALKGLIVGDIPMPEESVLMVALSLSRIFPHLEGTDITYGNWGKVMDALCLSRKIVNYSGEEHSLSISQSNLRGVSPGAALEDGS